MISDQIESIGIELEGGLNSNELTEVLDYVKSYKIEKQYDRNTDPSVRVYDKELSNTEIKFWNKNVDEFFDFVEYCFDIGLKQNSSCGNHIHIKFKEIEKAVSVFSFKPAWDEFINKYKEFAENHEDSEKYLKRLNSQWSKSKRNEKKLIGQLKANSKHMCSRYTAINLNAYNLFKTIEFRILPYFKNFDEAENTITWLIETVNEIMNKYTTVAQKIMTKRYKLSVETIECSKTLQNEFDHNYENKIEVEKISKIKTFEIEKQKLTKKSIIEKRCMQNV